MNLEENLKTGMQEAKLTAKLVSIADSPRLTTNGKEYYPSTVEFTDAKGDLQTTPAMLYGKNYVKAQEMGGMKIGQTYLCTARQTTDPRGPLVLLSHIKTSGRVTNDMFGFKDKSLEDGSSFIS